MRGEETELIGLIAVCQRPGILEVSAWRFCRGRIRKHAEIAEGKNGFVPHADQRRNFFRCFSTHSILRHSVRKRGAADGTSARGRRRGTSGFFGRSTRCAGHDLMSALFRTRTRQLLQGQPETLNCGVSSAGCSSAAKSAHWRAENRAMIRLFFCAGSAVADWYVAALEEAGLKQRIVQISPGKSRSVVRLRACRIG